MFSRTSGSHVGDNWFSPLPHPSSPQQRRIYVYEAGLTQVYPSRENVRSCRETNTRVRSGNSWLRSLRPRGPWAVSGVVDAVLPFESSPLRTSWTLPLQRLTKVLIIYTCFSWYADSDKWKTLSMWWMCSQVCFSGHPLFTGGAHVFAFLSLRFWILSSHTLHISRTVSRWLLWQQPEK